MMSILFLIFWFGFTAGMYYLNGVIFLIPLWFVLGYLVAHVLCVLTIVLHLPLMMVVSTTNKYKSFITRSSARYINRFALRLKLKITGLENVPKDGILTIYANHKSYADPFIILDIIRRPTTFTPKMSVYKAPILGLWLKSMGCFPIDRSSDRNTARAMVDAIKEIKSGNTMIIFPEGGIKNRDQENMVAMRAGAYKVATKAGADILPLRMSGTTYIKKRAPWRKTVIHVTIYPVITFEAYKTMSTAEIAEKVFNTINNGNESQEK
jgi:1-acyl-sn-glycerol-3-phosphate acyltransferase